MAAAISFRERTSAAAILAAATFLAAWIMFHRLPQVPVRIVEQKTTAPEAPTPPPPQDSPAEPAMKFEIVELPPPPAPAVAPAPPAPAPPSVQVARVEPAPEKPPEQPQQPQKVLASAPDVAPPPVAPLQPEARRRPEIAPLRVETFVERPAPPARPLQLLRPGDEKPSAIPVPVQPLHVETEAPVSRETKPTLARKAELPAPKTEAWVPKLKPRAPVSQLEPKAELPPQPAKTPAAPMIHVDAAPAPPKPIAEKEVATEGRVLLRMFEQGAGPSVEIRWPSQAAERDRLYDAFTQCLGMKVGLLDDQGHVYLGEGPRQQAMAINLDKYSGFVRRPEGAIATDEQREIARIRGYHGMSAPPARMFPRRVDAYLLGGLRTAVGDQYLKMKSVRAAYRLNGRRVMIESITADGRAVDGIIDLSTVASCN